LREDPEKVGIGRSWPILFSVFLTVGEGQVPSSYRTMVWAGPNDLPGNDGLPRAIRTLEGYLLEDGWLPLVKTSNTNVATNQHKYEIVFDNG
jgi:hypothetical protein